MPEGLAGDVYFIPKEASIALDPKDRRCPLMSDCEADEAATTAYTSTKRTEGEGDLPANYVPIKPRSGRASAGNGFVSESFVFPGILSVVDVDELDTWKGRLSGSEFDQVIAAMRLALGFGSGIDYAGVRGTIVEFRPLLSEKINAKKGVVIGEPLYARRPMGYQTIVPLLPDEEPVDEYEFVVEGASWLRSVDPEADSALFAMRDVFSVYTNQLLRPLVGRRISTGEMERIEDALDRRFRISEAVKRIPVA